MIKENIFNNILLFLLTLTCFIAGGYFTYVSAILSCLLFVIYIIILMKNNKIVIEISMNTLAIFIFIFFYLISIIWAVDSGMAIIGVIKFIPLLLFYVISFYIDKEYIVKRIPIIMSIMTIISFICMQLGLLNNIVSVNNRLAGFIQYPNTYALLALIGFIISLYQFDVKKYINTLCIVILLLGIVLSGSKACILLLMLCLFYFFLIKKEIRKYVITCLSFVIIAIITFYFNGFIKVSLSTFYGRLTYYKDAITILLKHPFGLGYYGYFFIQNELQTSIYSVVNVHNEFLQIMLDIGVIPSLLFYYMIIKSIIKSNQRNQMILFVILLHSLFDYDFQFIVVLLILVLFLNNTNIKQYDISILTQGLVAIIGIGCIILSIKLGVSEYYYINGQYQKSYNWYHDNTMAEVSLLQQTTDVNEAQSYVDDIINRNNHIYIVYDMKAQIALANGDIEEYMNLEDQVLTLAPYHYDMYENYFNIIESCFNQYIENNDQDSAYYCYMKLSEIVSELESANENINPLIYKTRDAPDTSIIDGMNEKLIQFNKLIEG